MNYISEINRFYDWLETNPVSDSAIVLWQALMHVNNKTGWKVEFAVAISTLELKTSLSKSSIIRARNILKQAGRIDFRSRDGQQSAIYRIVAFHTDTQITNGSTVVCHTDTRTGTQSGTQSDTQSGTQTDTIPKLNIEETKQNNSFPAAGAAAKKKKQEAQVPFWTEFVAVWAEAYKSYLNEHYDFSGKDFDHLKKIYRKLEKRAAAKNFEWTEKNATDGLRAYIKKGWEKDKWLKENFTISNLLTQFNQIANGQVGQNGAKTTGAGKATGSELHALHAKRFGKTG